MLMKGVIASVSDEITSERQSRQERDPTLKSRRKGASLRISIASFEIYRLGSRIVGVL